MSSAELLIATGRVDVNSLAPDLVTPLHLAAAGGHHEIVRLLLQKNAEANTLDIVGSTPLMYAAALNHPHTCNELLMKNCDITLENENGDTAYSLAVENKATLSQAILEQYLYAVLSLEKSGKSNVASFWYLLLHWNVIIYLFVCLSIYLTICFCSVE